MMVKPKKLLISTLKQYRRQIRHLKCISSYNASKGDADKRVRQENLTFSPMSTLGKFDR